ncbi:MAG: flagellar hook capping FlgD N-terminal domain-containing protein [Phycisphaeraceae bacterium]|nr:flagellar hook capping FlgD N-terminal domain-containing protein [Phycisphaeraceae bacterium]
MSSIASGISGLGGAASPSAGSSSFANLSSEEFFEVLFTELKNQDPLEPTDSSKMLEQLSTIRNIESQVKLQQQIESLVDNNQMAIAGGLIGKVIEGRDEQFNFASGTVQSVRLVGDQILLEIGTGQRVPMDNVLNIQAPPAITP